MMKDALKIAFPTVLAIVLGWIAVEGIKAGVARFKAEKAAKRQRDAIAARAAEAATNIETVDE